MVSSSTGADQQDQESLLPRQFLSFDLKSAIQLLVDHKDNEAAAAYSDLPVDKSIFAAHFRDKEAAVAFFVSFAPKYPAADRVKMWMRVAYSGILISMFWLSLEGKMRARALSPGPGDVFLAEINTINAAMLAPTYQWQVLQMQQYPKTTAGLAALIVASILALYYEGMLQFWQGPAKAPA